MTPRGSHKYGAKRVKIDGYTFDSQAEARRYQELKLLAQAREIAGLTVHPRFVLQQAFIDREGKKQRAITYEADFSYYEVTEGTTTAQPLVVEDVKGARTAVFRLKAKMFQFKYPNVDFRVIPAK